MKQNYTLVFTLKSAVTMWGGSGNSHILVEYGRYVAEVCVRPTTVQDRLSRSLKQNISFLIKI